MAGRARLRRAAGFRFAPVFAPLLLVLASCTVPAGSWRDVPMAELERARPGVDTQDSIRREFGNPASVQRFALQPQFTVWGYRYLESGLWHQRMSFYFDAEGVLRKTEAGPDPDYIVNR